MISYASHRLAMSQRNYSATKLELLACETFVQHFRHFLLCRRLGLATDHASLQWLINFRNPSGLLARWLERLSEFDFSPIHRPSSENTVVDALSRRPAGRTDAWTRAEFLEVAHCVCQPSQESRQPPPTETPTMGVGSPLSRRRLTLRCVCASPLSHGRWVSYAVSRAKTRP